MIIIPDAGYTYRILGIDNGTNTLGLSICDLDLRQKTMEVIFSETCNAGKSSKRFDYIGEMHGARFARFRLLRLFIEDCLHHYSPDIVAVEAPFMHIRPDAFAKLREAMYMIIDTVTDYDSLMELEHVSPISAKQAVKVKKFTDGKDPVRDAVLSLNDVYFAPSVNKDILDEHCIDSIAVAYFIAQRALDSLYKKG